MSKKHELIIASAIIWGVVIIACALALRGTGHSSRVLYTLSIGVVVHALFVWIPLGRTK
jgi:hypothetical protein